MNRKETYEQGSKLLVLGMVIQPLIGNPHNGYINPYYWVDDHPLLYGNNVSLDPSTYINGDRQPTPPGHVPPPRNKGLLRAYENHWFPLIRPAINPLFLGGGTSEGGRLTSH